MCSSGTKECVCFGLDSRGPTWTCIDIEAPGQGGSTIGFGGVGGTGSEINPANGGVAGRDVGSSGSGFGSGFGFGFGGSGVQSEFTF